MLLKTRKLKAFGITESVVASLIVVVILSAAVALSSSSIKTTQLNSSYAEAQHLSEKILESVNLIKSSGRVYFDTTPRGRDIMRIDCFDSEKYQTAAYCNSIDTDQYPLSEIPFISSTYSNGYYLVSADMLDNPSFGDNYFSYKTEVRELPNCYTSGSISIPQKKCRIILTDIKWEESSGEKHYKQGMYLTDWER